MTGALYAMLRRQERNAEVLRAYVPPSWYELTTHAAASTVRLTFLPFDPKRSA